MESPVDVEENGIDIPEKEEKYNDMEDEFGDEAMMLPSEEPREVVLHREFFSEVNLESLSFLTPKEMKPILLFYSLHLAKPTLGWDKLFRFYMKLKKSDTKHNAFQKMQEMFRGKAWMDDPNFNNPGQYRPPSSGGGDGKGA